MIFNQQWHPGWRAEVNGVSTQVQCAFGIHNAVRLKDGTNTVSFTYHPPGYLEGLTISIITLLLISVGMGFTILAQTKVSPLGEETDEEFEEEEVD